MARFCMGCMEQYKDGLKICPHCGYIDGTPVTDAPRKGLMTVSRRRLIYLITS